MCVDSVQIIFHHYSCAENSGLWHHLTTAGSLMDSWLQWRDKVIQFSKLESATRPALKQLLGDLESKDGVACPDGESLTPFA